MRVIEQARLAFREGSSDKVYEIDLVEVAAGQHVVNFRYGRRGAALRDGTKTATPVPLAKAKAVYDKLVAEKTAGGYRPISAAADAAAAALGLGSGPGAGTAAAAPVTAAGEARALVDRLRLGARGVGPLGPVVWKVSDRDLREAEPALLELIDARPPAGVTSEQWQHTVVAALVRCGTTAALPRLAEIAGNARRPDHVRDVARLAAAVIEPARARELARPLLPPALAAALAGRDAAGLARAAEELLATDPVKAQAAAVGLYLLDTAGDPTARPAVLAFARVARLSNREAAVVRSLYRLAELRRDGELLALCARRIDAHTGTRPFGPRTRGYFRRRVARVLRRLARAGSPDYVAMASALLLAYTDDDAEEPRLRALGGPYDRFARYHALNDTIYGGSPRYERVHAGRSVWRCKRGYQPGGPAPAAREERFPALWDRAPDALWRLVSAARATPVLEFATKALRANRAYVEGLSDDAVAAVLGGGHPIAQRFVYDLVKDRPLSTPLVRGALASQLDEAHVWVLLWIASHPDRALGDPDLLALLVTGRTAAIRDAGLALLHGRALPEDVARSAVARSLAILLGLPEGDASAERAAGAAAVLLRAFEAPLRELAGDVLRDLVLHPLAALGELAGEVMLRHARRDELPHELLELLLASPHGSVRVYGGRLLATTPAEIAKDDLDALELFATSANRELREGTRPLLGEIARRFPDVARALADRLVDGLLQPQPEGVPAHIVSLLRGELAGVLPRKPAKLILRLCGALSPHAREAGGLLLPQLHPDDLGLDDLARLASHEVLAIRQGAWALARASADRYRLAPVALSRLVDSPWEDTRDFAAGLIRGELAGALTADAIVAICDSIRPEVQALGKALLHEKWREADAGRYLVRLAEHPSTNLQLLVSGLLDHHVAGDLERLRTLVPYLVTVLSQVNRGAVAKARVMALLRREAARSPEAAALLVPVLDRQSATIAITQKHPIIATLVEVHEAHPDVEVPIQVTPPAPYARGGS
ncbi:MAG TPA: WGR domain-containing protein [Kofleriaceae bacterium]|nr:WGR domain-containing protein [Kofleriaceae bacterium]